MMPGQVRGKSHQALTGIETVATKLGRKDEEHEGLNPPKALTGMCSRTGYAESTEH